MHLIFGRSGGREDIDKLRRVRVTIQKEEN
jgi:hypothetical protein